MKTLFLYYYLACYFGLVPVWSMHKIFMLHMIICQWPRAAARHIRGPEQKVSLPLVQQVWADGQLTPGSAGQSRRSAYPWFSRSEQTAILPLVQQDRADGQLTPGSAGQSRRSAYPWLSRSEQTVRLSEGLGSTLLQGLRHSLDITSINHSLFCFVFQRFFRILC